MSEELKKFFAQVSSHQHLQDQLYNTKEVVEVAIIAREMGFAITGADILRAQVGRILLLPQEGLEDIAAGKKAKTGAQWGREGKGYLDNAGFWLNQFVEWGYTDPGFEPQIEAFLVKIKDDQELQNALLSAYTYNDIAHVANQYGYEFSASMLLRYEAIQILKFNDEQAEKVACGG